MTQDTYKLLGFLAVFIVNTIILWKEVKKYYAHEREMAKTNDMYISHISVLSNLGIFCGIISVVSFILMALLIVLKYNGIEWIVLQFNKLL